MTTVVQHYTVTGGTVVNEFCCHGNSNSGGFETLGGGSVRAPVISSASDQGARTKPVLLGAYPTARMMPREYSPPAISGRAYAAPPMRLESAAGLMAPIGIGSASEYVPAKTANVLPMNTVDKGAFNPSVSYERKAVKAAPARTPMQTRNGRHERLRSAQKATA